jgi:hypothetical protein
MSSPVRGVELDPAGRFNGTEFVRALQGDRENEVAKPTVAGEGVRNLPTSQAEGGGQVNHANPVRTNLPTNVRLQFEIDAETQDVTVLILDKASQKVLRTIPPEEMTKLQAGDLLELSPD